MSRKRLWILLSAVGITAIVIVVLGLPAFKEEPVKIGAIISMTGAASHLVDVRDGMQMAIRELNRWGGINGRTIELVVEDSRSDPAAGKRAFEKIEKEHHPLLYVSTNSQVSMALAPLAQRDRVVLVGLVVGSPQFTRQNPWVYKYYTMPKEEARATLQILEELKIRKLGILYQSEQYGKSIFSALKKGFEKTGGRVVGISFPVKNPHWKMPVESLMDTEGVFVVGYVKNEAAAIKALKEAEYAGVIMGASGVTNLVHDPLMNGVYMPAPLIYNRNFVFARKVQQHYEAIYQKHFTHQAATGYDLIQLLAGLLADKPLSRGEVRKLLARGFAYPGIFGELDVAPGTRDIIFPLYPARITNGKIQFLR